MVQASTTKDSWGSLETDTIHPVCMAQHELELLVAEHTIHYYHSQFRKDFGPNQDHSTVNIPTRCIPWVEPPHGTLLGLSRIHFRCSGPRTALRKTFCKSKSGMLGPLRGWKRPYSISSGCCRPQDSTAAVVYCDVGHSSGTLPMISDTSCEEGGGTRVLSHPLISERGTMVKEAIR